MRKHLLLALAALVVLAVPVAASAGDREVHGPATFHGHGWFGGTLEMRSPADTRPVTFAIRAGRIGILDLAGDARVRCGEEAASSHRTDKGTVYVCRGARLTVEVHGSDVQFRGAARGVVLQLPAGAVGELHGFRFGDANGSRDRDRRTDDRRPSDRPTADRPAQAPTTPSSEGRAQSDVSS